MPSLLTRIQTQLGDQGLTSRTEAAHRWLLSLIPSLHPSRADLLKDQAALRVKTMIGRMYFFYYEPKGKEVLPYYDRFPLVIPMDRGVSGFLGLNLHYLPPKTRLILLHKLSVYATNARYDETTRFRVTYDILKGSARIYEHTPAIKQYLYPQVRSRFLEVTADQWDIAAMLPTAIFRGATISEVYADSRAQLAKRKG